MGDDNNSELEEMRIDRQRAAMATGDGSGASIRMRDGRVSKLIAWAWATLGMAAVSGTWIAANNLYQLNVTVARGIDMDASRDQILADHEQRLRQMERDVSTIEGKVFRGVPGYEEPVAPRGPHGR